MNHLTVTSHPFQDRYPSAVAAALNEVLVDSGRSIDVLDLQAEAFDPRFTSTDHAHFWGGPVPHDIAPFHDRILSANSMAFVFPIYWWGMPALMKGWIERTFTEGFAYRFGKGVEDRGKAAPRSLLCNKPTLLIGIGGAKKSTYEKYKYAEAMYVQIDVGTFAYCGITDVQTHIIYDVEGDEKASIRAAGISEIRDIAERFAAPERKVRNVKTEHLKRLYGPSSEPEDAPSEPGAS